MPIPSFDHNLVLPPHLGNPANLTDLSPYSATSMELVQRFATSFERVQILSGFLNFREQLQQRGLINGFQWLDGSFLEDIEAQENRAPNDLDLVTVYWGYDGNFQDHLFQQFPEFRDPILAKQNYHLDHYPFDAGYHPDFTVEYTRYWVQLFTHNRNKVWKGMIKIDLNTLGEDAAARQSLLNWQAP
jgi:hypothetical protein